MAGDLGVEAQQPFADAQRVGVGDAEADVVAQRADVGDVVVEPLELEQKGRGASALRAADAAAGVFDGEAVGEVVADGGVAGDPFGELDAVRRVRPWKSRSMPLWTNHRRAFMLRMVSPTTENRKWPGSMRPACTGPTGIS